MEALFGWKSTLRMLTALNHLTLAVTDLPRSLDFYTQVLGCRLHARWDGGRI